MTIARAQERLEGADIHQYTVVAGQTVRKGFPVKTSSGNVQEIAAIGDNGIGIALDAGDGNGTTAPTTIRVVHWGKGIVKGLVGTGAATQGSFAKYSGTGDGLTDGTIGGGTTKLLCCGQWLEAGAAGEYAGLNIGMASATVGS